MTVSVLIPVYNTEPYVAETVESALSQSVGDIEIIAVDDGSTDGCANILREFGSRITVVFQSNQGVSAARNRLLDMARGEWLVFLDADDVLLPNTISSRLATQKETGADVVLTQWQRLNVDADGVWQRGALADRHLRTVHADPALALFKGWWSPPGAVLVRHATARAVGGFRVDLPVIQDARFLVDVALSGASFAHADHVGLLYRERDGVSLSRRDQSAFWRDCLLNAEQVEQRFVELNRLDDDARLALMECYELVARELGGKDVAVANRALTGARRHCDLGAPPSRWLRLALIAEPILGARIACRLAAAGARVSRASTRR